VRVRGRAVAVAQGELKLETSSSLLSSSRVMAEIHRLRFKSSLMTVEVSMT